MFKLTNTQIVAGVAGLGGLGYILWKALGKKSTIFPTNYGAATTWQIGWGLTSYWESNIKDWKFSAFCSTAKPQQVPEGQWYLAVWLEPTSLLYTSSVAYLIEPKGGYELNVATMVLKEIP